MNNSLKVKGALIALPALVLCACQEYEPFDYATVHSSVVGREYTANFIDRYGLIDTNNNWGFGPVLANVESGVGITRVNISNKNQWEDVYHLQVPGWPDVYETSNGQTVNNGYHYVTTGHEGGDNNFYPASSTPRPSLETSGILPGGDVTDEEIQYVSWWFRTHQYPGKLPIHCSDYFIQEISSDNDRDANGHIITAIPHFNKNAAGEWVPTMENGEQKCTNQTVWGLDAMEAKNLEEITGPEAQLQGYDHVKNFNQNASNNLTRNQANQVYMGKNESASIWSDDSKDKTDLRLIEFYSTSGTEDFAVHCSQDESWKYEYALVHLHFVGPSGRIYDGYYIGFDYECDKINDDKREYRAFDGYYSNWIVKLTPAEPMIENNTFSRRIMCEDLGNTYDFDFNDVVFDVTYNVQKGYHYQEGDPIDVTITLRSSGGTLPIYVGKNPQSRSNEDLLMYEAHHLLGQNSTNRPINVGKNTLPGPIATYHLSMNSSDPEDIQIWVENNGNYYKINNPKGGNLDQYNGGENGDNAAPQKFAVPVGVRWMQECEFIEKAYPVFKDWVSVKTSPIMTLSLPEVDPNYWYTNDYINPEYSHLLFNSGDAGIENTPVVDEYAEYGTRVALTTASINNATAIALSNFDTSKQYQLTVIVESQNDQWNQEQFEVRYTNLTNIYYDGNSLNNGADKCTKIMINPNDKIYGSKTVISFADNSAPAGYDYLLLNNLNGISSVLEVRIKEV